MTILLVHYRVTILHQPQGYIVHYLIKLPVTIIVFFFPVNILQQMSSWKSWQYVWLFSQGKPRRNIIRLHSMWIALRFWCIALDHLQEVFIGTFIIILDYTFIWIIFLTWVNILSVCGIYFLISVSVISKAQTYFNVFIGSFFLLRGLGSVLCPF